MRWGLAFLLVVVGCGNGRGSGTTTDAMTGGDAAADRAVDTAVETPAVPVDAPADASSPVDASADTTDAPAPPADAADAPVAPADAAADTRADATADAGRPDVGSDAGPFSCATGLICAADQYCVPECCGACGVIPDGGPCPAGARTCTFGNGATGCMACAAARCTGSIPFDCSPSGFGDPRALYCRCN